MRDKPNGWIVRRAARRQACMADARRLIMEDERQAYYAAHRCAACARADGDAAQFMQWTKMAKEVAKQLPLAEMDRDTLQRIIDDALSRRL